MNVISIFTWQLTPWAQAHYKVGEVVVVEHSIAIEATTITWDATVTLTITNICQLKTMLYLHVLQFVQLQIIVEIVLKDLHLDIYL